jgi:hypothetical protein
MLVRLPPGDHLTVIAGAHLGEPAYDFDHPNIAAKKSELFEFKHYRTGGSKFWTSKAGISFSFVIPKAQIELLAEKGFSYVPVLIHGRKCRLNVSGGTGNGGWTDHLGQVVHVGCGGTIAAIDWGKTAEANSVTVSGPVLVNRIGPILEPLPI